jgi:Leucine-rich repeat (LRR) protein
LSGFNLKELPLSIGQLNTLRKLDLSLWYNLKELPSSIGQLNALQKLDLWGCSKLKELPSSIGQLNALRKLYLRRCSKSLIGQSVESWKYLHLLANWMHFKSLIC